MQGDAHAAFADLGADAFEGFFMDFRPNERVDRARTERDQIRTDAVEVDVIGDVVIDYPLQRLQIMRGHFRQLFRGRVFLHEAADVCVRGTDVEAGIADGHRRCSFRSDLLLKINQLKHILQNVI